MCGPPCAPMLSSLFSGGAPKNVQLGFELSTYISRVGVSDRTDPYAAHDAALTAELESGVSLRAHVGTFSRGPRARCETPHGPATVRAVPVRAFTARAVRAFGFARRARRGAVGTLQVYGALKTRVQTSPITSMMG